MNLSRTTFQIFGFAIISILIGLVIKSNFQAGMFPIVFYAIGGILIVFALWQSFASKS